MMQFELHKGLVEVMHGTKFTPRAICPGCSHVLTDYEIMRGFRDDRLDVTTGCPKCKMRFEPRMKTSTSSYSIELALYCPMQTLARMENLSETPLDEFRSTHADVYHSAVLHFGGLNQAFKEIGLTYAYEADLDWTKHVNAFLGKLPDTVIAKLVGTSKDAIRRLRIQHDIEPYSSRQFVENDDQTSE